MLKNAPSIVSSHASSSMPIRNVDCSTNRGRRLCWRFVCVSLERTYSMCGYVVFTLCLSNKVINVIPVCRESSPPPTPPKPHLWGSGTRPTPTWPRCTLTSVIRPRRNPIQGRSMPPTQAAPPGRVKERESLKKQWWAILQTAITDRAQQTAAALDVVERRWWGGTQ